MSVEVDCEDEKLFRQSPEKYQQTNSVCQLCLGPTATNATENEQDMPCHAMV